MAHCPWLGIYAHQIKGIQPIAQLQVLISSCIVKLSMLFAWLKPVCTTTSAQPLFLPLGQKEASVLGPYCLDKCLHLAVMTCYSLHHTCGCRTVSTEAQTNSRRWPHLWPIIVSRGTEQQREEEIFSIPISSGQAECVDQKIISPGRYVPAFQEDRWSSNSNAITELLWEREKDERYTSAILPVMLIPLIARNVLRKQSLTKWLSSPGGELGLQYHSTSLDFVKCPARLLC